jgi:hypothetical protein
MTKMKTPKPSKSTGPKTVAGKTKSSRNAIQHGLSSTQVMPDEQLSVESFVKELISYYKPESPLELLQIQRIAFCRAKLSKLIDIEIAGRQLAQKKIENDPNQVLGLLKQYPDNLLSLGLKMIQDEKFLSKVHFDFSSLKTIAKEIDDFSGLLTDEDDLPKNFPKLCKHLKTIIFSENQTDSISLDTKLMLLANTVSIFLESLTTQTDGGEFEAVLRQVDRAKRADEMATRPQLRKLQEQGAAYHNAVLRDFEEILKLWRLVDQLDDVINSYLELKDWLIRSADLNNNEADRMMRYQTNLERRLSSAIGELLELQKFRPPKIS